MTKRNMRIEASSGNVFADLGFAEAEAQLAKAELARRIGEIFAERGLTQAEAAELLHVDQPKVSALLRGRLGVFPALNPERWSYRTLIGYALNKPRSLITCSANRMDGAKLRSSFSSAFVRNIGRCSPMR